LIASIVVWSFQEIIRFASVKVDIGSMYEGGSRYTRRMKLQKKKTAYTNKKDMEIFMLFTELKCRDVINIRDCRRIGKVSDLEIDECNGCILKIMVSECGKFLNFLNTSQDYVICFKDIKQIGPDIILVDIKC